MELLSAIGSVLWRLSLKYRNVQPGKVLLAVKKQHLLMRLFLLTGSGNWKISPVMLSTFHPQK